MYTFIVMVIVKGKTSASLHGLNVGEAPAGTVFAFQEHGWNWGRNGFGMFS